MLNQVDRAPTLPKSKHDTFPGFASVPFMWQFFTKSSHGSKTPASHTLKDLGQCKGYCAELSWESGRGSTSVPSFETTGLWRSLDKMSILPKPNSTLVKWVELDYLSNSSFTKLHLVLFVKARERYTFQICVSAGSGTCEPARNAGGWHTGSYVRCFRVGHPVSLPYFSTLQWPKEMLIAITLTLTASCV